MIKHVILWLMLGFSHIGYSQILTVTDAQTGRPLDLVTVLSQEPRAMALTNTKGEADISAFEGSGSIEIRLLGYDAIRRSYAELKSGDFKLSMQPGNIDLQQVVVSATRWRQPSRESPEKVAVISTKEVALQNPQTAADLLNISGEVFVQKSQLGGGSPMIRGFSTNRLLYAVDGVRMNNAIFRSGNLQNVIALDPFSIENTEVLFGPGSVMYGSDAIGAVMSFQTLQPRFALRDESLISGSASLRYSSAANEKTGHFDVNVGWKRWALVTSFSSFDFGDLRMGTEGPDEYLRDFYVRRIDGFDAVITNPDPLVQVGSGYTQKNLMQKVGFKPNTNWDFTYAFHYSESSDVPRYDRLIRTSGNGTPRSAEWYYGPQLWIMNNLEIKHKKSTGIYDGMSLKLAHQQFEESRNDRAFNSALLNRNLEDVMALSANLDFLKNFGPKTRIFYGAEVVNNDVRSSGRFENILTGNVEPIASRYPDSQWMSYGAYATLQTDLKPNLVLQTGARYTAYQLDADFSENVDFFPLPFETAELNNGAVTGSAGLVYRPTEKWSLSTNLSTGFRAPNVDDIGKIFESLTDVVVVPNPELEAEYAYNAEIGIARILGESVKIDFTAYYTYLANAMVRRDFTLNGQDSIVYNGELSRVQAIQNAASATVYGVQAGIEIKLPKGFSFSSRINYQIGEEELDDGTVSPSRHAPPTFGMARLNYSAKDLTLQLYANFSAEVAAEDLPFEEQGKSEIYAISGEGEPYSPAWATLNIKALYRLNDTFSLSTGVENLGDVRYRPYSSGIVAPGRNFIMSLSANF